MNTEITPTNQTNIVLIEALPLDQNPAAVYLASLESEGSRRNQKAALDMIAGLLTDNADAFSVDWSKVRYQHTTAIRTRLAEVYAPSNANRHLSALRQTLKRAFILGQMGAEEYQRAIMVDNVKGETLPAGRELGSGEIVALMTACENDPSPAGVRDAAIIGVMYVGGLRRAEITAIDLDDYDPETGRMVVRGKRRKERTAYLENGSGRALIDWLAVRGDEPGPLFLPVNKGGKIQPRRMTTQAIYNMLDKRGKEAGVSDFSPHDMRRTFVSDHLAAGTDIAIVAKMAGHASVTTTARYDRRPEEAKREAAGRLHLPYRGRSS